MEENTKTDFWIYLVISIFGVISVGWFMFTSYNVYQMEKIARRRI